MKERLSVKRNDANNRSQEKLYIRIVKWCWIKKKQFKI